ncbi:preprotein translocase subunit SecA, partial [Clostridium sp.]|uniref:preprotein translocase subunit SecA n=1 Tax=Clostridium sp. TaxID=1506 RepID=UPI00346479D3
MGIVSKVFGSYSERELKKVYKIVDKIEALDDKMSALGDEELKNKTEEFKSRLNNGETLDDILVEAFAVLREASFRVLKKKHYRVQLVGGVVLHQGRIAEMKTGEGKTLVATLPAYLNALGGNGVHVITVNDYLAQRDKEEMGRVYEFLGLTTGVIIQNMDPIYRRESYNCDITYGTNSEFGFDYLRDNMVSNLEEKVQRKLNYCVIDEVDSILIDEARTPLIISGGTGEYNEFYKLADYFAKTLKKDEDFTIDHKAKAVLLNEEGIGKAENFFNIEDFMDLENLHIQHYVVQALKANYTMEREVDYIVKDNKIYIVDEFTGRIMDGRRFSEGLHSAIEAKEGVKIEGDNKTLATITYQNFFRIYKKLAGMTGTAKTEEYEFREIYALDVIVIPTNKDIKRIDNKDLIYKDEYEKFKAVADDIENTHKTGQPVLVGTVSIEKSEILSFMLKRRGISHQVLNAKHHEREAEIVAKAGEKGMVTIATNMAGRGTDILLGDGVKELGGLKVIGTERHESRRIDNQLRGRSGRQGDVGESRFYVSFEDELINVHASEKFKKIIEKTNLKEGEPIEEEWALKAVENAQKNVESNSFDIRKNLIQYDDVISKQREVIYGERDKVLSSESLKEEVDSMIEEIIVDYVEASLTSPGRNKRYLESELMKLIDDLKKITPLEEEDTEVLREVKFMKNKKEIITFLKEEYIKHYEKKLEYLEDGIKDIEKEIILKAVDDNWVEHLEKMDHLKQYIG